MPCFESGLPVFCVFEVLCGEVDNEDGDIGACFHGGGECFSKAFFVAPVEGVVVEGVRDGDEWVDGIGDGVDFGGGEGWHIELMTEGGIGDE